MIIHCLKLGFTAKFVMYGQIIVCTISGTKRYIVALAELPQTVARLLMVETEDDINALFASITEVAREAELPGAPAYVTAVRQRSTRDTDAHRWKIEYRVGQEIVESRMIPLSLHAKQVLSSVANEDAKRQAELELLRLRMQRFRHAIGTFSHKLTDVISALKQAQAAHDYITRIIHDTPV